MNRVKSSLLLVTNVIHQGSDLGSLLFNICISDLDERIE